MAYYILKEPIEVKAYKWLGDYPQYVELLNKGIIVEGSYDPVKGSVLVGKITPEYEMAEECFVGEYIVELFQNNFCILDEETFLDNYIKTRE